MEEPKSVGTRVATLRIHQHPGTAPDRHRIEIEATVPDRVVSPASVEFAFAFSPQEHERIRWYLEDYFENPHDPVPKLAAGIETRMRALGEHLFDGIFRTTEETREVWSAVQSRLHETRIEIATGVAEASALPWELMTHPKSGTPLALLARPFVRVAYGAAIGQRPDRAEARPCAAHRLQLPRLRCQPLRRPLSNSEEWCLPTASLAD